MVKHSLHVFISDCNCLKSFKIFISRPHTRFLLASYNKKPTNKIRKKMVEIICRSWKWNYEIFWKLNIQFWKKKIIIFLIKNLFSQLSYCLLYIQRYLVTFKLKLHLKTWHTSLTYIHIFLNLIFGLKSI